MGERQEKEHPRFLSVCVTHLLLVREAVKNGIRLGLVLHLSLSLPLSSLLFPRTLKAVAALDPSHR